MSSIVTTGLKRAVVISAAIAAVCGLFTPNEADAETIKLGFIGPLSGGNALQGTGARNGFLLAIQQANEDGYPYEVEPVALDDASDPATGVSAALKLVNDPDVVAAIGHWNSPVALATTPVFNRYQMPFIIWGAISPKITEANFPEVTRVTPTLAQENKPLADWVVKTLGLKQIAIVSDTSDYGVSNTETFQDYVTDAGAEIVSTDAAPVGTTDFRAILTKVKASQPDAIYFGGVITEAALVRKQMHNLGMDIPMLAISGIYDEKYLDIAGEAADGTIVSYPKVKSSEALDAFNEAYEGANFDDPAGPYAKYAFDATNILLQVIEEHGPDDREALASAIREIDYKGALGRTTFDENGQTKVPVEVDIYVAKGGEWVPWEAAN
ncbi:branched-chain amino acid ABC transporter substrate-binding protein [Rhodospirillaceae bacterium SYSU D60014]|uniref:branched-chain amino acid ABC transporter substrate-binding protein n=1 Tax=Virgifigura deserti TaxID=2268457 RepID=UPI000E666D7B